MEDTLEFISAMKEVDMEFSSKVQVISRRYCKVDKQKAEELKSATAELVRFCIDVKEYVRKRLGGSIKSAQEQAETYVAFVKEFGKHPSQQSKDSNERSCATWAFNYRRALNGHNQCRVCPKVNRYLDAEVPGWKDLKVLAALNKAEELVTWMETNHRLPSANKLDEEEKVLYNWVTGQRASIKSDKRESKAYPQTLKYLDEKIPLWRDPLAFLSLQRARELVKWVDETGSLPLRNRKEKTEESSLRIYLDNYRASVKNDKTTFKEVTELLRDHDLL